MVGISRVQPGPAVDPETVRTQRFHEAMRLSIISCLQLQKTPSAFAFVSAGINILGSQCQLVRALPNPRCPSHTGARHFRALTMPHKGPGLLCLAVKSS
ncbi:hypothetical protein Tco_0154849 [Tanacetum coccineum]